MPTQTPKGIGAGITGQNLTVYLVAAGAVLVLLLVILIALRRIRSGRRRPAPQSGPLPAAGRQAAGASAAQATAESQPAVTWPAATEGTADAPTEVGPQGIGELADERGNRWVLDSLPASIGRADDNRVVVKDSAVSARHASIAYDARSGALYIEDLDSLNGLLVDGLPTRKNLLQDGARLQIGKTTLIFRKA